ncbi:MAG: DegT/DnrJ/EryC1/StrS family aminotransferase [Caldilinea sp.]|nr:DegT/DnrJ/EryC1/StrS family aminotransferase [Caldilineaceae bacterium]MCB9121239.1 DegT/DnrJ/EryC1/StrS family aminotransferase [Caldilineaceae bacterium]MCW5840842.1 DegT/DnrJ/EryC1/StrS family aminotransferase [Caldilinea sp.]
MRDAFLPFALPDIDESELAQIGEALASGWITTGPKTRQFEAEFAAIVGARHAIAVNSCTAAMHLALEAVGLQRGDEVITTPYTFAASAEVVRYFDARPVLVDVNAGSFNIDVDQIEAAITSRTKAIIPVHIAGQAADLDAIYAIAQRHKLAVIEDAAHAFPTTYRGRMIGAPPPLQLKHAACFSFYATKTIATGEGGMICTDDDEIADRCRIMALHGISKDAWKRYTAEGSWYYEIIAPGYKYNLTDVASAMGLAQLAKAERMWRRRTEIAHRYTQAFAGLVHFQTPCAQDQDQHAWHLYMLRLNLATLRIDRARFIEELKQRQIGVSVHFIPLHIHPYYRDTYGYQALDFPVAYGEFQREISLPIYSKMSDQDVQDVIDAVVTIAETYRC